MKKETYLKYRNTFEQNYKSQIDNNKHDLRFVNLHDLKNGIRCFDLFVFIYSYDVLASLFTNTVSSIDKRKRFAVKKNTKAIKIKIPISKVYLVDQWDEYFDKVVNFYYKL